MAANTVTRNGPAISSAASRCWFRGKKLLHLISLMPIVSPPFAVATAASIAPQVAIALPEARVLALPETLDGGLAPSGIGRMASLIARADALLLKGDADGAAAHLEVAAGFLLPFAPEEAASMRHAGAGRLFDDGHRMGVAAEALEEAVHLVMHHGVARDAIVEIRLLGGGRQLSVEQQVAGLEEVAVLGELIDRVAAIEQDALVAVDIGDLRLGCCGRGKAGIVGEHPGLAIELGDVDDARADGAFFYRQFHGLVVDCECAGV